MPQGEYTMFKFEGVPFGGVMKTPQPGVPTHWLNYVSVEDIDASFAKSGSLGARPFYRRWTFPMSAASLS